MQICKQSQTKVETIERLIRKYLLKCLGVLVSLINVALYCSSTKLKLPTTSLVKEYCDEEIRHPNTFSGLWGKEVGLASR